MPHFHRVRQVMLKLTLATVAIIGAVLLYRWLLWPALVAVLQPGELLATQSRRFGILLFALLGYWGYVRRVAKRSVRELHPAPVGTTAGLLAGAGLCLVALLPLFAIGAYEVTTQRGLQDGLPAIAGFILIAAMLEEVAYRGVLFQALEEAWGTGPAMWGQSLVFAVAHLFNIFGHASVLELATMVVSVTLLGVLLTLVFVLTRNLWVAGLSHAAWNFTILLSGVPLSGIEDWRSLAPLVTEYRGPAWLTGGVFGPENSLVTIALAAVAVAVVATRARRAGRFVAGGASPLRASLASA